VSSQTIFGRSSTIIARGAPQAFSGYNTAFIAADGRVDIQNFRKHLQDVMGGVATNKALVNEIANRVGNSITRDSHVPLLYNMLVGMMTARYIEGLPKVGYTLSISFKLAESLIHEENVYKYLQAEHFGLSTYDPIMLDIRNWAINVIHTAQAAIEKSEPVEIPNFTRNVAVITCPNYQDGHTIIATHRFHTAGFCRGRFKIDEEMGHTSTSNMHCVEQTIHDRDSLDDQLNYKSVIDVTWLEQATKVVLVYCLYNQVRRTPFLVDNPAMIFNKIQSPRDGVCFIDAKKNFNFNWQQHISSGMFMSAITDIVTQFRLYDDLSEAVKYIIPQCCQPEPNTTEAHAWFNSGFNVTIPAFVSFRSIFACVVTGTPHLVTKTSRDAFERGIDLFESILHEGVFLNAQWRAGLFLAHYHFDSECQVISARGVLSRLDMRPESCIGSLAALVTGNAHWKFLYDGFGVMPDELTSCFRKRRNSIHLDQATNQETLGGTIEGTVLLVERPVAPAGLPLVLGEAGPLIKDTPIGAQFTCTALTETVRKGRTVYAANTLDTWRHAVAARWLGYDLDLDHGYPEVRRAVAYAANDDQIIVPIMPPESDSGLTSFIVPLPRQRLNSWSAPPTLTKTTDYAWSVENTVVCDSKDHRSRPCYDGANIHQFTRYLHEEQPTNETKYTYFVQVAGSRQEGFSFTHTSIGRTPMPQERTDPVETTEVAHMAQEE
jgi:hypothetical protein